MINRRDSRDPLRDLLHLQERINRLFEESVSRSRAENLPPGEGGWVPLADVSESAERYVIQIEIPGIAQEDVSVQVEGPLVTVRGARRTAGRPELFHRMERSYGSFTRAFRFETPLDGEGIALDLQDGILRIEVAKQGRRGRRGEAS